MDQINFKYKVIQSTLNCWPIKFGNFLKAWLSVYIYPKEIVKNILYFKQLNTQENVQQQFSYKKHYYTPYYLNSDYQCIFLILWELKARISKFVTNCQSGPAKFDTQCGSPVLQNYEKIQQTKFNPNNFVKSA